MLELIKNPIFISVFASFNFVYSMLSNDDDKLTELNMRELFVSVIVFIWLITEGFNQITVAGLTKGLVGMGIGVLISTAILSAIKSKKSQLGEFGTEKIINDKEYIWIIAITSLIISLFGIFAHWTGVVLLVLGSVYVGWRFKNEFTEFVEENKDKKDK